LKGENCNETEVSCGNRREKKTKLTKGKKETPIPSPSRTRRGKRDFSFFPYSEKKQGKRGWKSRAIGEGSGERTLRGEWASGAIKASL